jgi:hypothetical protein
MLTGQTKRMNEGGLLGHCQFGGKREIGSTGFGWERLLGRSKRNEFLGYINCFLN